MAYITMHRESDDTEISGAGVFTNDVEYTLRADQNEVGSWTALYVKAADGYIVDDVVITPTGDNADMWQLAADDEGSPSETPEAYGDPLDLGDNCGDTEGAGKKFHVRAKAVDTEDPINDITVTLVVSGIAKAE